ncbi:hypothetical protein HAX54_028693 [Datura stramonium]|uniref:CGL160/ATPI domain-containing protein n=1 Tax=Datura stramonium TaxID=4076 RepID=A0ABS8S9T1_DATST|nr:hypothetical protein [Datura stramonium]
MAVLNYCYLSVTSTATPISQDSANNSTPLSIPTQTKATKLRKYWGEDVDPLTSDDFIWNREFMGRMKKYIQDPEENAPSPSASVKEETSGFLSLNRVMSLDRCDSSFLSRDLEIMLLLIYNVYGCSLEIDLTKELTALQKRKTACLTAFKRRLQKSTLLQEKWGKAAKAATGGSGMSPKLDVMFRIKTASGSKGLAAQSREQYLKCGFYAVRWTQSTYQGAAGQPRLLVPVALVTFFNRGTGKMILVPEYGFMHLELIPMLVGFFTYKIATFVQAIEEGLSIVGNKTQA